jgi:hypothetical protein
MVRYLLILVLLIVIGRVFWRLVDGIVAGMLGPSPSSRAPLKSTAMVRDPVCGTFVVPERSVTLMDGPTVVHFCSAGCRDKYQPDVVRRA